MAIKSDLEPLCLKAGTISKLAPRGFFYGISANESQSYYTTILIPPGSEYDSSNKTYSPDVTTVVLGINNTVRWTNQAESANSIAADMSFEQDVKKFGSDGIIKPGQSYEFTFTKPGTFSYHGEPHPWQRGKIIVISSNQNTTPILDQNNVISSDFYQGMQSSTRIVSIKNQTYYMMTATNSTYPIPLGMIVRFHQVTFSFPYGSLATPGGEIIPFVMTFPDGTTESYGKVVKNSDGSGSMSGIGLGPGPSSNMTITDLIDHIHSQAGVTLTENQIKLLVSTDVNTTGAQTSQNTTLPDSFLPCDTPYPQSNTGVAVLYMPANSTGKICVQYTSSNPPVQGGIRIFEAHDMMDNAHGVSVFGTPEIIPTGNSTVVYTITTGNHVGFYGLTIFCAGMPFAIGYDSNSTFAPSDFPWYGGTYNCPAQFYNYHIVGLSGIGGKYIPYP
jgi:plastocyanin